MMRKRQGGMFFYFIMEKTVRLFFSVGFGEKLVCFGRSGRGFKKRLYGPEIDERKGRKRKLRNVAKGDCANYWEMRLFKILSRVGRSL